MQNSRVEDQENIDQRKNLSMEDSTAMTIEFLRARLLSERSVSRTARQRADQLAKKVLELEEQIQIVTIQREKAEKALAEVLAVLDSHGVNELSEGLDSNSDQEEVLYESKESNSSVKEEEQSMTSKSGSELEVSPNQGRSLSWKGGSDTSISLEKKNFSQARRRHNGFTSTGGSSQKHRMAKSCRRIKRRDTKSESEDGTDASLLLDAQENGADNGSGYPSNHPENRTEITNEGIRTKEDKVFLEVPVSCFQDERKENGAGLHANGSDRDVEMERALEQQAQLIGLYEAEENAQREWEEKFRENNGGTLDSCERSNQSDITEERNKPKSEVEPVSTATSAAAAAAAQIGFLIPYEQGYKLNADETHGSKESTTRTLSNTFPPMGQTTCNQIRSHVDLIALPCQQHNGMQTDGHESRFQNLAFHEQEQEGTMTKAKQNPDQLRNRPDAGPPSGLKFQSLSCESPENQLTRMSSPFQADGSSSRGEWLGSHNQQPGVPPLTSNGLGGVVNSFHGSGNFSEGELLGSQNHLLRVADRSSKSMGRMLESLQLAKLSLQHELGAESTGGVLEALQLAKLSLQHELQLVASPSHGALVTVSDSRVQAMKAVDAIDTPIGTTGLFRLPTESQPSASYQVDFSRTYFDHGSGSARHGSDSQFDIAAGSRYPTNPHMDAASRISSPQVYYDPYLDSTRFRIPSSQPFLDPGLDSAMRTPSASRNSYLYTDFMERLPSSDNFPQSYSDARTGMPQGGRHSVQ